MLKIKKLEIDKLNRFINDCITIEKNIANILLIKQNIEECNSKDIKIHFLPEKENEINEFINTIKSFGKINEEIQYIYEEQHEEIKNEEINVQENNEEIKEENNDILNEEDDDDDLNDDEPGGDDEGDWY